jgi:hypothetical protein
LTGLERKAHYTALQALERMETMTDKRVTSGLSNELIVPWEAFTTGQRQLVAVASPLIGTWTTGYSDLLSWSMVLKSGATVLGDLKANAVVWEIGQLPTPSRIAEVGQGIPTSPVFAGVNTKPWLISGIINVSAQLLKQQASPDLKSNVSFRFIQTVRKFHRSCVLVGLRQRKLSTVRSGRTCGRPGDND